jgi:hypothetical protein
LVLATGLSLVYKNMMTVIIGINLIITGENIMEMMIKKFSEKYDLDPEVVANAFLHCHPPENVDDIVDFPNDYLVEFLRRFYWHDVEKISASLDWKRFDSIQWSKLYISFGNKLDSKRKVKSTRKFEELEYLWGYH